MTPTKESGKSGGEIQMAAHEAASEFGWDEGTQTEYDGFLAGWWACWRWLNPKSEVRPNSKALGR